jgi:hypothetical protein
MAIKLQHKVDYIGMSAFGVGVKEKPYDHDERGNLDSDETYMSWVTLKMKGLLTTMDKVGDQICLMGKNSDNGYINVCGIETRKESIDRSMKYCSDLSVSDNYSRKR